MKYWWQSFNGALTKEECEWLISYAQEKEAKQATVGSGSKSIVNESLRRSKVR